MAASSPFKNDILKGKVTLVSGGGSGINFGIARSLGLHGSKIAIMGRRKEVLESSVAKLQKEGIDAFGVQGDVRKFPDCQNVVASVIAKFGKLDILVNGAAGNFLCAPEDLSVNGFKTVIEIDTIGTFHMSKASFESLKATKGVILNISATLHYTTTYYQIHASAAKAAVDSMTRSLAVEWGKYGIRSVGIAPGPIADTEGMSRLSGGANWEDYQKLIPLRRAGTVEDIAQAALYLTAIGTYVTGHTIVVDGGSWLHSTSFVTDEAYAAISAQRKAKL